MARSKMFTKAGLTRDPKRKYSEGGKQVKKKKYACGGKIKK